MIKTPAYDSRTFAVIDYDLPATLNSGQAFRWVQASESWIGVIGRHWVRLTPKVTSLEASTAVPVTDWAWLEEYLQLNLNFPEVLQSFPSENCMNKAVAACHGLRLLRQDPWECLASFILSSTKQIVQIRQIIELLCTRFGDRLPVLDGYSPSHSFPSAGQLAQLTEADLRACKMGFRAPYLLQTAMLVAREPELLNLRQRSCDEARARLQELPGVGRKIADCVLLFAYGYQAAFPIDVWIARALKELYFSRRRVDKARLVKFAATHFGPFGGYAQQYLFHYMRTLPRSVKTGPKTRHSINYARNA